MQDPNVRRFLSEAWNTAVYVSVKAAVAQLMEEKGGEAFLAENAWMLDEPQQLAVHELDHPEVREIKWGEHVIKLRWSVVRLLCKD